MKRRILLDTQAFAGAVLDIGALSPKARSLLKHPDTVPFLSLISVWELQIKLAIKKLKLPTRLSEAIQRAVTEMSLELLPLQAEHIYKLEDLPFHHRDSFDRLLIAQALHEQMPVLSNDEALDDYGVTRIW